jgi:UDP-N-acetylglucosamine 2-epimerase
MINVIVVFGTRPEAIKMAPVIKELKKFPEKINTTVTVSAQHREMLDQVLEIFNIKVDYDLNVMTENQNLSDITRNVLERLEPILSEVSTDIMLVQGDTTTTFASSLAAFYHKIPVGHIEAGLRTYDRFYPYPEEINRTLTSVLSSIHFAPTTKAKRNLLQENISENKIIITGNTVIDAFLSVIDKGGFLNKGKSDNFKKILVTAHRRENLGKPLENICKAILNIVKKHSDVYIVFPVHLNPRVRKTVFDFLFGQDRIQLIDPLGYKDFSFHIATSHLILTDSGGIQEEAPSLGIPVLVLRNETERPEGVEAGTCRLVGTQQEKIYHEADLLLRDKNEYLKMAQAINPYGDGKASKRIVEYILSLV